jgi:hypothetical protein
VSRPPEYGPGVVVEEPPAKGRVDLVVEDLLELSRRTGCQVVSRKASWAQDEDHRRVLAVINFPQAR